MDDDSRKWLLAADSDPEYIKHCRIDRAARKDGKPLPPETRKYFFDNCGITDYLGMDSQLREELLASDETEGETQMRHYCRSIKKGEQPSPETIEFFNRAFQEIQSGTELKQALRIKKKRGRKKTDAQYALEMDAAILVEEKRADGLAWSEAVAFAGEYFHKDDETIKGYHKKCKKAALGHIQQRIELRKRNKIEQLQRKLEADALQKKIEEMQETTEAGEFQGIMEAFQKTLEADEFRNMVDTFKKMFTGEKFQKILEKY